MQKTGNIDPATGKEEYLHADGSKSFLNEQEYAQLSGIPQKMPDSAFIQPGHLGNFGIEPAAKPIATAPMAPKPAMPAPAPKTNGIEVLGSDEVAPVPLMAPPAPMTPTGPSMVGTTETQRTKQDIPKDVLKAQNTAFKKAEEAVTAKMDAETKVANATALKAQEEAAISQRFLDQEAVKQAAEQANIDKRQSELDAISAEYSNMEIDSNNYWAKKSTGDSILAALAIGLGTFGHVASGAQGESPVLKILQSKIDQDIEIQKANMSKAGNNVATQRGLFSDVLKRTGDEQLARLKTHELGIKSALAQFDQQIAKSNNELVMAKYQQEKAAMENELVNNQIAQVDRVVTSARTEPAAVAKPLTGTKYEKSTGDELGTLLQSIKELDGLEKVIKEGAGKEVGPIIGRFNDLKSTVGLPVSEEYINAKTRGELIYLVTKKFYTGLGSGVRENVAFQKLVPNVNDTESVLLDKLSELRKLGKEQYSRSYAQEAGRYNDPTAITGSFPDPRLLNQNTFGFKPQPKGK